MTATAPLSFGQRGILGMLPRVGPGGLNQHLSVPLGTHGADRDRVAAFLVAVQGRYDAFRTAVLDDPDRPEMAFFDPGEAPEIEIVSDDETWDAVDFAVGDAPQAKARLRLDGDQAWLDFLLDHVAFDGWSIGLLWRDLPRLWAGDEDVTRRPAPAFQEYLLKQARTVDASFLEAYRRHWGAVCGKEVRLALPRRAAAGCRRLEFDVPARFGPRLATARDAMKTTDFCILVAAAATALCARTGQASLLVHSAVADRTDKESMGVVGCLQNSVGIRVDVGRDLASTVASCRSGLLDALRFQRGPYREFSGLGSGASVFALPRLFAGDSWQPRPAADVADWRVSDSARHPVGDICFEVRGSAWGYAAILNYESQYLGDDDAVAVASAIVDHLDRGLPPAPEVPRRV